MTTVSADAQLTWDKLTEGMELVVRSDEELLQYKKSEGPDEAFLQFVKGPPGTPGSLTGDERFRVMNKFVRVDSWGANSVTWMAEVLMNGNWHYLGFGAESTPSTDRFGWEYVLKVAP